MAFYEPNRENYGSYFFDWSLSDDIAWRNFYQVWFKLLVLVDQNPLQNLFVLFGRGDNRLNDRTGRNERVGRVRYTIKDGIVYDAKQLLADVAARVEAQKKQRPATSR